MNSPMRSLGVRLAAGEVAALEDCYRRLGPMVLAYLRRYVPPADAEDVLQKVFVELWRHTDRYDPNRPLEGWVLGIARKRAIDHLRAQPRGVVSLDGVRELTGDDGREAADRYAWAADVHRALGLLPDPQREVLRLAYFDQLTQSEIADRLSIPLGTVKTRMARGMQRLAALLDDRGDAR